MIPAIGLAMILLPFAIIYFAMGWSIGFLPATCIFVGISLFVAWVFVAVGLASGELKAVWVGWRGEFYWGQLFFNSGNPYFGYRVGPISFRDTKRGP